MTYAPDHVPARAGRREWTGLAVLGLVALLVTMDLTILFLAVPQLSASLDPSGTELLWITDAYGFVIAGALIVMGTLGDRLGRRRVLLLGAAGFGAASVLAAAATSPEMLIVARGLQGLAGAALLPSTMALVFAMFSDEKQRTAALGAIMGTFALGAALGPLLGGALLELADWRAVFVPNVPVMALLLVLGPRFVPEVRGAATRRIDIWSAAMSVAGVLVTVWGVKELAQDGVAALPLAGLGAGIALFAAFVARQRRLADPLIDVSLFGRAPFSTALAANAAAMFVTYGTFFFTAQYLQLVAGLSPLEAGLWGLPPVAAMMLSAGAVVPQLVTRVRPAYLVAGGMLVSAAGLLALSSLGSDAGAGTVVLTLIPTVIGLAPATTIGMNLVIGTAPPQQAGSVSGLGEAVNELGGALGIAILGTVGGAVYRDEVATSLEGTSAGVSNVAGDTLGGAVGLADQLPSGAIEAASAAFAQGLGTAASIGALLLVATAGLVAFVLRRLPASEAEPQDNEASREGVALAPEPA